MDTIKSINVNGKSYKFNNSNITSSDIMDDDSSASFNIGDMSGNVLVEFKDGHIRTKEFDSKNINQNNTNNTNNSEFSNLNVIILGDSITWLGGDECNQSRGWTRWFKEKAQPKNCRSFARSGAKLCSSDTTIEDIEEYVGNSSANNVAYNQLARIRAARNGTPASTESLGSLDFDPDIILIALGTNDGSAKTSTESTIEEEFSNSSEYANYQPNELTTLEKAIRYICEQFYVLFPNVQIFIITPQQSTWASAKQYFILGDMIEYCCDFLSVNCIRLDKHSGTYRTREGMSEKRKTYDGCHTSEIGAKENGYYIYNQVKSMLKY